MSHDSIILISLFVAFQIKHFICDFPLQTPYMLGKLNKEGWELPLLAHCGVHSAGTLLILLWTHAPFSYLGLVLIPLADGMSHLLIDICKVEATRRLRYTVKDAGFWNLLGLDQFFHQIVNIILATLIAGVIVRYQ